MKPDFKALILPPLLAAQFLTRVPIPWLNKVPFDEVKACLPKASVWFAFVGGLIGLCTAAIYYAMVQFFPIPLAIIIALSAEILITGSFHEDAFADFCDGFGGGLTPERVHEIMKDSRVGTYGTVGLFFALAMRLTATIFVPPEHLFAALLFSESLSRVTSIFVTMFVPQANFSVKISKDFEGKSGWSDAIKSLLLASPFWAWGAWVLGLKFIGLSIVIGLFLFWLTGFLKRKLGGRNGDCLGASIYIVKILCLLTFCIQ